MVEAGVGWFE
uniref:Uncharacterized protein n=1 Tax=Lepeophtheirus salmonis TaxID=72036 RepID=A0A0K2TP32_LEPSM